MYAYTEEMFFCTERSPLGLYKTYAKQPIIAHIIDKAMITIEKENPSLKGVPLKNYARPEIDKTNLGER